MLSLRLPAAVAIIAVSLCMAANAHGQNTIQLENAKPGTPDWQLTNPATNHEIEGYASLVSVNRGDPISFFVNTADPTFTLEIFRMGWYGGAGARLLTPGVKLAGTVQPIPTPDPTTGLVECQWLNPYTITITADAQDPTDWASGVYLVRLIGNTSGKQSYIIFIIRDDARASTYLFQASTNTFEAYNNWGGKSLYAWNSSNGVAAINVSYNRPFALGNQPISAAGVGAGEFLTNFQLLSETPAVGWCYPMLRFLEREGYDVGYISDVDAHENSALLLSHKGLLVVGHSEYWSWQMRSNVQAARDAGVNLGFFSSNTCYWQVRFAPSATGAQDRTIICYKSATADPDASNPNTAYLTTTQWRLPPLNMPEEELAGVMYSTDPVNADIIVTNPSHWVYTYTGLQNGDHLPGMLGYEVDSMHGNQPADTVGVAHETTSSGDSADTTVYTAASGATVFASGSFYWSWGLDDFGAPSIRNSSINPGAQQVTRNILSKLADQAFAPAFSIIPSPRLLTVSLGSSVNFAIKTTAFGYSPTLTLSLSGLPTNVPYTFSPATVSGSMTSTLTISPTAASTIGAYLLTISANDGTRTRTEAVTVNILASLLSINVAPASPTVTIGGTQQFVASGNYQGGGTQDITPQVTWASSNPAAVTINTTGLASGSVAGVSTIQASLSDISGSTTLAVDPPESIRYVQSASGVSYQTSSQISTSFGSSTAIGDTIIVAPTANGSLITSVVDTQGNTYQQAVALGGTAIWYAANIHGGEDTITAQFASDTEFSLIYIHEYAGLDPISPLDQVSSLNSLQNGKGTSVNSGTVAITQAHELLFGYASVDSSVSVGGAGFTVRQTAGGNMSEDRIVSSLGTYAATFTQSVGGGWTGMLATFKAGVAGPPVTLQSIAMTPTNPTISIGSSPLQMTATGTYSDASKQNITSLCSWTSSAAGVATVNSAGQVTPVAIGSASIKCTDGSLSGSTTANVTAAVAGIRYVQSASTVSSAKETGVSVTFTSNTNAGNAIVVAASTAGSAISSVTDSQGNAFTKAVANKSDAIFYATSINGGADTVTANFASSTGFSLIYVHEYAGLAAGSALDQVSTQTGSGTALTSGAATTTQARELIFGYASVDSSVSAGGVGFTVRQTAGGNMSEDMVVSAAGTYSATFTQNISSGWAGLMATFIAASIGPPPTLVSVAVTPANPSIAIGGSPVQMTATGTYSDSSNQNITSSCSWTSNATGIATVSSGGLVTGLATSSANITCAVGAVSGFTTVTVTPAVTAIRYVQSAGGFSGQNAARLSVPFKSSTTLGDTIVVAASTAGPVISSVGDTQGNTYVQAVASGSNAIWYATNIKGGADKVTANFAASTGFSILYIHEYSGLVTNPLDQVSSQTGTGTAVTSGAKPTTQANELIFGYASVDDCVVSGSALFTVRQTAGCNMSEDMIMSTTGSYAATFMQNISGGWTGLMATFK
jgi:Bacterial Ig-like domain (group 2)